MKSGAVNNLAVMYKTDEFDAESRIYPGFGIGIYIIDGTIPHLQFKPTIWVATS